MQAGDIVSAAEAATYESAIDELIALRVSVARIAQAMKVENDLYVKGLSYTQLRSLAMSQDRGWNDLAGRCFEWVQDLKEKLL